MDNQSASTEPSNGAIDTNEAASLLAGLLDDSPFEVVEEKKPVEAEAAVDETKTEAAEPEMVEVDIDGYKVSIPADKAAKLEAERLMQADYTKKTTAAAETRKAAEAETAKARAERDAYAQNLNRFQAQLEGTLQEQQKVDWEALLNSDPVEYLRQQHLAQARQAQLQQVYAEQQKVASQQQAEAQEARARHLQTQQQELIAKLPEWRDEKKAAAEQTAIRDFLVKEGYDADSLNQITDARAVVLARKAMLYDQMVSKARTAADKIRSVPPKVERPGTGEGQQLDRRTSAYQRLSKSGSIEDAAALLANFI